MEKEMCRAMEGIHDEYLKKGFALGREEGKAEGREEGRTEGREEGRVEALLFAVRNAMKSQKFTVDEAMDIVGIPEDKREQYKEMLQEVAGDDHQ